MAEHIGISRRSSAVREQFETSFNFFEILWRRVGRQEPPWLSRKVRPVGLPVLCLAASARRGGPHGSSTTDSRKPRGFLAWTLFGLSLASQSCSLGVAQGRDLGAKAFLDSRLVHHKSVGGCLIWDGNRHSGSPGIPVCSPGDTADVLFY
jgi:hypothetical protein